jgi:thiol-disulfide isomerase/thioredoxin
VLRERALAEHKVLLVDATAEWCGPCKMMDRTTWVAPTVVDWVRDHALAIQIDVDAQKDLARELRIEAMPTIIAFIDGTEFDRIVGGKSPREVLEWLDGVMRGETSLVVHRRQVQKEPADMCGRFNLAKELIDAGHYDEAVAEHVWLWQHMLEHAPSMYGVRRSFFAGDLATLVDAHAPARVAVTALRDDAAPPDAGVIEVEAFRDWVCLNGVLGEAERTLAWYDALPAARRARLAGLVEHDVVPLLLAKERWADAGQLYVDPLATLDRAAMIVTEIEKIAARREVPPRLITRTRDGFRTKAAQLVRALRAADRDGDADAVENKAREIDPSQEMATALANARTA